ncbi:hypothetical protein VPHD81_0088 [Vibrio phage D81]
MKVINIEPPFASPFGSSFPVISVTTGELSFPGVLDLVKDEFFEILIAAQAAGVPSDNIKFMVDNGSFNPDEIILWLRWGVPWGFDCGFKQG